jgi:trans-aconitate 2-methyltransferase
MDLLYRPGKDDRMATADEGGIGAVMMWDAQQYLKFSDERSRPFGDLLDRIVTTNVKFIADLGCGPGNLTRNLSERWPTARVLGVDNSPEMLEQARSLEIAGRLDFLQADIRSWSPDEPVDLIVSNAAFQWVNDHAALLARLVTFLSSAGTLAVQMPYHFQNPAHLAIEAIKVDPRWRESLWGVGLQQQSVMPLEWYVERLLDLGLTVDAWQTTYIHILSGENPVLEWFKGTALRPLLKALEPKNQAEFLRELGDRLKAAYPVKGSVTLLPFPRVFFAATRRR